ncbi:MAG TPA: TonB C-terminal domain-containing protein, partial [Candidatus Cybelea sp.]|nr:TonB C-terminal domain-containing protein [Candidatus Cybelea sp.]
MSFALALLLAVPIPSSSPSPTTDKCNHEARLTKAVRPDIEDVLSASKDQPLAAEVQVIVTPSGSVDRIYVSKSSGDLQFDMA